MENKPYKQTRYQAYRNKITNKIFGVVHMPARTSPKKGDILISYLTEPFTVAPPAGFSNYHTMYWECYEIARLFAERGYDVDIINTKDHRFIPRKRYIVCIDAEDDLDRLTTYLPAECKKVFHILIMHWNAYNQAEKKRLDQLEERRGFRLLPRRTVRPSRDAELADELEGFGNQAIFGSFAQFGKKPFWIPISAVIEYDFPAAKDLAAARTNFLWIGGGGAVLKGLDLVLEAFARMPDLHLHICGPIYGEPDFVEAYKKELTETPNIHVYGRIDVGGPQFVEIAAKCAAVIYPSGAEGSSGAIIQAMHAGLIPMITPETGVREDAGCIILNDPTPASVEASVRSFSAMAPAEIEKQARAVWSYARAHYTRAEFSRAYDRFITEMLKL